MSARASGRPPRLHALRTVDVENEVAVQGAGPMYVGAAAAGFGATAATVCTVAAGGAWPESAELLGFVAAKATFSVGAFAELLAVANATSTAPADPVGAGSTALTGFAVATAGFDFDAMGNLVARYRAT